MLAISLQNNVFWYNFSKYAKPVLTQIVLMWLPATMSLLLSSAVPNPDRAYCIGDMGFSIRSSGSMSKLKLFSNRGVQVGEL